MNEKQRRAYQKQKRINFPLFKRELLKKQYDFSVNIIMNSFI